VLAYASWWVSERSDANSDALPRFSSVAYIHSRWLKGHVTRTSFSTSFARNIDRSE
jgi:hypothetical protein